MGFQWRIEDFPDVGTPTPKLELFGKFFAENCTKMKEFGPPGGGGIPRAPLDPSVVSRVHSHLWFIKR